MAALGTTEFWDTFHEREDTEWYLPVDVVVREVLSVYNDLRESRGAGVPAGEGRHDTRPRPRVFHPGCGTSTVGIALQREHGCSVVNADFSEGVVKNMAARFPGCDFAVADARSTGFPDNSFDVTVDKGLFDSVTAGTNGRAGTARQFLEEAARVLSPGGKYVMFSVFSDDGLGHKDMAQLLAHSGFAGGVEIRVLDIPPYEYPDHRSSYVYILTKTCTAGGSSNCSESDSPITDPIAPT